MQKENKKIMQTKYSIPFVSKISTMIYSGYCRLIQHFLVRLVLKYLQQPSQNKQKHIVTTINKITMPNSSVSL